MKFVFEKKFKFKDFPAIYECHTKYSRLVDESYDMEEKYENGECTKEDLQQTSNKCIIYYEGEYAMVVHNEFYGKGLKIANWDNKKPVLFDDVFPSIEGMSKIDKNLMLGIVEVKYGWKLPADFYEKR